MSWLRDHFTAGVPSSHLDHVFCQVFQVGRQIICRLLQAIIETSEKTILCLERDISTEYRQSVGHLLAIYMFKSEKKCRFKF